jgi:hypothetical protein
MNPFHYIIMKAWSPYGHPPYFIIKTRKDAIRKN